MIDKILIIRMSSIGDVILTSPVIRQLRQKYPRAQIDFLIRNDFAELVRYNPHLSNIIEFSTQGGFAGLRTLKQQLKSAEYDVVLDLHRSLRSQYLFPISWKSPLLTIKKNKIARFLLVKFKLNLYKRLYGLPLSVAEKYLKAAEPLTVSRNDLSLELHLPDELFNKSRQRWADLSEHHFKVAMAPGARHYTKRWPANYYAELIEKIYEEYGWRTLLLGGPDEVETISEIQADLGEDIQTSLAGEMSLLESFAMIKNASFFISNDSGLMHTAAAFQIPQIAIFGSTTPELGFSPINPNATVVENEGLKCRPCSHIGRSSCPKKHFKCMLEVTPQRVFELFRKMVEANNLL